MGPLRIGEGSPPVSRHCTVTFSPGFTTRVSFWSSFRAGGAGRTEWGLRGLRQARCEGRGKERRPPGVRGEEGAGRREEARSSW